MPRGVYLLLVLLLLLPPLSCVVAMEHSLLGTGSFNDASRAATVEITTQMPMRDENGHPIDGADGCLIPHVYDFHGTPGHSVADRWWAYGLSLNSSSGVDVNCYASIDLGRWSKRNCTMQNEPGHSKPNLWANVLFNRKTSQYVVFTEATTEWIEVYVGPTPTGPFTFTQNFSVPGYPGDMTIFQDPDDDKAYLVYNSFYDPLRPGDRQRTMQRFTFVYELNAEYLSDAAHVNLSSVHNTTQIMEGLWMTKDRGTYFLFGSPLVCDDVGDDFYLTAKSPLGPWTYRGLFAPKGSLTFHTQVFRGFEVRRSTGAVQHVYVGLRWCHYPPGEAGSPLLNATRPPVALPSTSTVSNSTSILTEFEWVRSTHARLVAGTGASTSSCPPGEEPCQDHPSRCCESRPANTSCPPQPCKSHPGRTFCPNDKRPRQCEQPMPHAACPPGPCPPSPSPQPHCSTCHCCTPGPQKTGQPDKAGLVFGPSGIWLPIHFNANGTVAEMQWYDSWELDSAASFV